MLTKIMGELTLIVMPDNKFRIAMIDDERSYLDVMELSLENDFDVMTFTDSKEAIKAFKLKVPDAVILDVHLKETDGFKVFHVLKTIRPDLPIFYLSCNNTAETIGQGLLIGSTDYLTKNMATEEIISRVKSRLQTMKTRLILRCREIEMDTESREVRINQKIINFTPKEYDILKVFMEHQDEMLSKPDLLDLLWKGITVDANNIDTHMFHIRKKFGKVEAIECRKGVGYILNSRK